MNLDIFENLIDKVKENEFIQNFTKELEKNIENSMQKSMLEKFVSDNKIISEYKDKMLINRNMILQELNNNEMYYIYDKKGSDYLATICEKGKSHEIIRIPERDVKSNVKIDSVLRKTNDKFELDEETTRLIKNKMEEMFKKILEEQNKMMESRRIDGHIYEYVEGSKNSVWLIDNNLNNGEVFEEIQQEVFKDAQEGDLFEYINGEYKIKNRLYEIENCSEDLIRISKSCIININHVTSFDMGEKGRIAVKLDDDTKEIVSRRKIKEVINFLDERGI